MTRLLLVALALLTSGCVGSGVPGSFLRLTDGEPSGWAYVEEPSMAPDFRGMGDTYPVLLVHSHHVPSERQKEYARNNPIVCLDVDGAPIALARADGMEAAMAACMGPAADAATGRLFVDREDFDAARPRAVALIMGSCSGGAIYLGAQREEFLVSMSGHDFRVRSLPNGTFTVDDLWVRPGTALKIAYYLHRGDAQDEEYVRVVFDAPGGWLLSRVGERLPDEPPVPPRPDEGTGLAVEVPLAPATMGEPISAALAATPGAVAGIAALRIVHDGERLTELTLRVATGRSTVTWYGVGRTGDAMRLLGAEGPLEDADMPLPVADVLGAFDRPWAELRAGAPGAMTDARLAPDVAWSSAGVAPLAAPLPLPCEERCVYARGLDGAWSPMLAAQPGDASFALTLAVLALDEEATREVWWHAPPAPASGS